MAAAGQLDYTYETSDDSSESELLDRSLSVWKGLCCGENEVFTPIPLDLHTASSIGQCDCVRSIIQREDEVDLNKRNRGGWTALMYASYIGHDTVVDLLLDAGVSVNVRNNKDQTPLMLAASCGNENVAYLLLQAGAELEAQDTKGWTALFHATYSGHQNMVKFLLDSGAHTETVEPTCDFTPFMEAAAAGHEIIVQCFLQHGVNVNAKTAAGETPRSLAHINGHIKIVSLIDNHLLGPAHPIRSISGSSFDGDLSSSDDAYQAPKRKSNSRNTKTKNKGPNIGDGPERLAKIIDKTKTAADQRESPKNFTESCVPCGYVTFVHSEPEEVSEIRFRDMISPISLEDHSVDSSDQPVDSSDGRDSYELEDESDVFSKTGALTIKSSSSSSGGLVAALGLSQADGQVDKSVPDTDDQTFVPGTIHITGQAVQSNTASKTTSSQPTNYLDDTSNPPSPIQNNRGDDLNNINSELKWRGHSRSKFKSRSPSKVVQQGDRIEKLSSNPSVHHAQDVSKDIVAVDTINAPASSNPDQPSLFEHLQDYGGEHSEFNTYQYFSYDQTPDSAKPGVESGAGGGVPSATLIPKSSQRDDDTGRPKDLEALLDQICLPKYLPTFAEQDVDLQVFLSLTDNDLKEIGIKLFGPRRKMTNAIARWHSEARPSRNDLEQTYADKLEAEMQELAIQLHQAYEQIDQLKQQVLQETKLRSVTESWLMEDRVAWQHVHHVATDTRQRCAKMYTLLETVRQFQEELARRLSVKPELVSSGNRGSLAVALQQRLSLEDNVISPIEIGKVPTPLIFRKMHELFRDVTGTVAGVAINSDKLLGREIDYNCPRDEIS